MASNDSTTAEATATPAEAVLPAQNLVAASEQTEYVPSAEDVLPEGLDGLIGAEPDVEPVPADGAKPFEPLGVITNRP
ncbi:hypothetical protein [Kitasatospora sp. NPDC057223]|uniref:hypothetical protein n=1 Tax=Kitasatospora sp. NPDC057223 TaxID=3346055 RepID=UPI003643B87C